MKAVSDLSHESLVEIVELARDGLYLIEREPGDREAGYYDPDKDWEIDTLSDLAGVLNKHGLVPEFLGDEPRPEGSSCDICGGNH